MQKFRLGVDIGGTFTDAILMNMGTGELVRSKVSTTPEDFSLGFVEAESRLVDSAKAAAIVQVVHACTVATNAVIEGKVANGAFITTKGFRDLLEIQRQIRPKLYDLFFDKPKPLIERRHCYELTERMSPEGKIMTPLDDNEVEMIAHELKKEKIESVAVCLLHSYLNPIHETKVAKILSRVYPEAYVTLSSDIAPQFREYFRASTAVVNTVIMPIVSKYLDRLERRLASSGLNSDLYIMQSNGGLMTSSTAKRKPVYIIESGPAAGVIAASTIGKILGHENVLSFDMGGTTAKVGLIENGEPKVVSTYEVGSMATNEIGSSKGSGYPLKIPVIDLVEIGAGGGSIAWVDSGGIIRVGPQSAAAVPGPACYDKGGVQPTVTDANLVLGRIDPEYFLGGEIKLHQKAAELAIKKCGDAINVDLVTAARGIIDIANANMIRSMRLVSVERGYDPRDFTLIAYGGAGPMHANALASEFGIPRTLIPTSPGLFSAMGLLITDLKHDFVKTYIVNFLDVNLSEINNLYNELEAEAAELLRKEGISDQDVIFIRRLDMRYLGQSYELTVPIPRGELEEKDLRFAGDKFHEAHERAYGHSAPGEALELVNIRLAAIGKLPQPKLMEVPKTSATLSDALFKKRNVYFSEIEGFIETPCYLRPRIPRDQTVNGPSIIEDFDSTTVISPGYQAQVMKYGELVITPN